MTPEHHLIGKPVTVVYEITDPVEWRKTNPLQYEHHGLKAYCVMTGDADARIENLREALERIAQVGNYQSAGIALEALKADNRR